MRIIFVTPLLWKRLDRAVRRREEGQALILIALAAVAMVAVVGLAVDGGLAYLEAQKLQRAADAAALAGVIWVPNQAVVADGRGKLSAQANGYKVYKDAKNPDPGNNWTYDDVVATNLPNNGPGDRVMYIGEIPRENQYRVTMGRMAQRYFLGVIGLGNYYIQRVSTAEYSRQVKLGSSFNYMGSTGVLYDPSVNATDDPNDTYGRYVANRCNQVSPPPNCVGTFWSNIGGTDWVHGNGDAYNPINDGQVSTDPAGRWSDIRIKTDNKASRNCYHSTQPTSWFVNDTSGANTGLTDAPSAPAGSCVANGAETNPPILNQDIHPDSGNRRNFGYEIGIQIDERALVSPGTVANHTNINISIYDAAMASVGGNNLFGTGDQYSLNPAVWGNVISQGNTLAGKPNPELTFQTPYQGTQPHLSFYPQRFIDSNRPYTGTVMPKATDDPTKYVSTEMSQGRCPAPIADAAAYGPGKFEYNNTTTRRCLSQYWITDTTAPSIVSYNAATSTTLAYGAGQPYRFNEMRTRYTLYWPPKAPGVTSNYANVSFAGNKIGAFEVGDMSIRTTVGGYSKYTNNMPIERDYDSSKFIDNAHNPSGTLSSYCYIVSLNPPRLANKTNPATGLPTSPVGNDDPATLIAQGKGYNLTDVRPWNDTQFVYACGPGSYASPALSGIDNSPPNAPGQAPPAQFAQDYYWGMPFPSSLYPYDEKNISDTNKTVPSTFVKNILGGSCGGNGYANLIYQYLPGPPCTISNASPGSAISNTNVVTWQQIPAGSEPGFPYNVKPVNNDFLDPGQECRISVGSAPGRGSIGTLYGGKFPTSPIEPLYQYGNPRMPFNAAYGDRINTYELSKPTLPPSDNNKYNVYYFSRHGWRCAWDFDSDYDPRFNPLKPGGTEPLDSSFNGIGKNNPPTNNGYSVYGNGKVEPFFHLTNYTWSGSSVVPKSGDPVVRAGTYMLHVQTYGGSGANRYSVKAEYENANNVTVTVGYDTDANGVRTAKTKSIVPVPNVFGISTFSIYTNAQNANNYPADVLFDLAYIPPENAGATAILQLFDPGDVSASLSLSLLEPSKSGNILDHSTNPPSVAKGNPISVTVSACPYFLNNLNNCKYDQSGSSSSVEMAIPNPSYPGPNQPQFTQHFNDQWVSMVFQIPSQQVFNQYRGQCELAGVPEEACYYFQVDYRLGTGNGNDTTTWQLVVQGAPVRLLR